jgi:hypothetical protein
MGLTDNSIEESMATLITIMSERMAFSHVKNTSHSESEVYKRDEWLSEVWTPTSQNHFKHAVRNPINKISPTTQLNRGPTPRAQEKESII